MNQHLPSPLNYREDINGLRAWAVIAVLLFHFKLIGLSGGFVGVDVFFVISGYLMTAIIIRGYEKESFSIGQFYLARIRRILPALLVLVTVLLILGWFWLPTSYYKTLGDQAGYAISFVSNIFFWTTSGYFDSAAEEKWLLHTWSLAVEAQFYLLYPLFIAFIWRLWKTVKAIALGVLMLLVVSLALNIYVTQWQPSAAFYLFPTRSWELAAGALVFLIAKQRGINPLQRNISYWLGWGMLIGSFIFISNHLEWPGYWAMFPVIGTGLIILGHHENSQLTNNVIAQWVGDRSYSLYLWHWPLVVTLNFASLQNKWSWVITAFSLSILFAHFSYRFVEVPTRQRLSKKVFKTELRTIFFVWFMIIVFGAIAVDFASKVARLPSDVESVANEVHNKYNRIDSCSGVSGKTNQPVDCYYDESHKSSLGIIAIGDSHTYALFTALGAAAHNYNFNALHWAQSACPFIIGAEHYPERYDKKCSVFNENVIRSLEKFPGVPVVLVARWNASIHGQNEMQNSHSNISFSKENSKGSSMQLIYKDEGFLEAFEADFIETVCQLKKDREVFIVRPIPEIGINVPDRLSRNIIFGKNEGDIKISRAEYDSRSHLVWKVQDKAAQICGAQILDPLPYLCDSEYCYGSRNQFPLYFDDDHLSEYGNKRLIPMFEKIFE